METFLHLQYYFDYQYIFLGRYVFSPVLNQTWSIFDQINVTVDHKTSHKGQFFKIEINTSSER